MTPAIIIDVIIAAILIAAVVIGARKGLFLSLAGIMIFLLALVGANIGAKSLSVPLADQLTPKIQERIAVRVEDTLQEKNQQSNESLEQMLPDSLKSILEHTGLLNKLKDDLKRYENEFANKSKNDKYYWGEYRDSERIRHILELIEYFGKIGKKQKESNKSFLS